MSFLDVVSKLPVIGYSSAIVHYCFGDTEDGHKAFYQATRSTVMAVGSVVGGALAGPVGAAGGGVWGGTLTDAAASAVTGKGQGVIKQCEKVGNDIEYGRDPTKSIFRATSYIALDAATGLHLKYGCRLGRSGVRVHFIRN